MGILAFIIILSVLVIVHEFGHFFAARKSGVTVEEFGIGFPPRLFSIRRGTTLYSINAIPFGGFVRLLGEDGLEAERPDSFRRARFSRQFLILLAGVIMNFLMATLLMTIVLGIGVRYDATTVSKNRYIQLSDQTTQALTVPNGAAALAGIQDGDEIVSIDNQRLEDTAALVDYVKARAYPPIVVTVARANVQQAISIIPQDVSGQKKYGIGVSTTVHVRYSWLVAPWYGLTTTTSLVGQTLKGFGTLVSGLAQGHVSEDVTGPIGIAVITHEVSQYGFLSLLQFAAVLSVSLAVLNVLPLPALDGGRAVFRVVSWASRREIDRRFEASIHTVGFYLLIAFLFYISIRDVGKYNLVSRVIHWFQ